MENLIIFGKSMKESLQESAQNIPKSTSIDISSILNWIYALAGLVAVGFIVLGAINYATAVGDSSKVKQAGQTILFAIIGLVVVLIAAAITNFAAGAVK